MFANKNYIVAIALSIAVLLGWQYFVAGPRLEAERLRRLAEQAQVQATQPTPPGAPSAGQAPAPTAPGTPGTPTTALPGAPVSREAAIARSPRLAIDTPALAGSINLAGGRIDDLKLKGYRETVDRSSPNIVLLSPAGAADAYFAEFGWVSDAGTPVKVPGQDTVWTQEGTGALSPSNPVTIAFDNGEGYVFKRTFAVDAKYMFTIKDEVTSAAGRQTTLYPYSVVSRHGTPHTSGYYILHEGPIGVFGDEGLQEPSYKDLKDKIKIEPPKTSGAWIGFVDKYWATALIPDAAKPVQPRFASTPVGSTETYQTFMLGDGAPLAAGGTVSQTTRLFAGAKEVATVDGYAAALNINKFDRVIDWGWFYFITKPLFFLIDWLNHLLGNFGLAILAVTVIVKALFFPLANKSYDSMSKMKKIQPEMKELQERFKEDRAKQQQAMMELYRREKINPLAGCVPILLQIPVFFSLYKVLFITIEMRQAPFYGWIHDLASHDPTSLFNLFGLIPWQPPAMLMIGVWPLIMGVTMFVQMKMNPTPPDPTQKIMFDWMPVLFTFMLANMPAGLVIYWAWNNSLSILQQGIIMRKNGVKIELWDNIKGMFGGAKASG
ncbi:membrane protein insertase YidC [Methyloraptor flagellatus]|jgi:YidC/Oxa1 family membrane protein insertase|uniref:Membrane protein insertase YidC n=1 Tax=Methyloraptor flagellatus TaxID=3162530 RepID=A0AAU7X5T1_9HYPH